VFLKHMRSTNFLINVIKKTCVKQMLLKKGKIILAPIFLFDLNLIIEFIISRIWFLGFA